MTNPADALKFSCPSVPETAYKSNTGLSFVQAYADEDWCLPRDTERLILFTVDVPSQKQEKTFQVNALNHFSWSMAGSQLLRLGRWRGLR